MREKRETKNAAERVFGVVAVVNQVQVRIPNGAKRADADRRGDVLQALMLDRVPKTVDAKVDDGSVTLTGTTVSWQYQRDEAKFVAANIVGTLDLFDEIRSGGSHSRRGRCPERGDAFHVEMVVAGGECVRVGDDP